MSQHIPGFSISMFLGFVFTFLVLCGIIAWTTWIGFRLRKVEPPKLIFRIAIAFLQILLGGLTVFVVKAIHNDPFIAIGTGLGITILSGPFFMKLILKCGLKQTMHIWAIAAGMQLVFVPVCAVVMVVGWVMISFLLYPPQF